MHEALQLSHYYMIYLVSYNWSHLSSHMCTSPKNSNFQRSLKRQSMKLFQVYVDRFNLLILPSLVIISNNSATEDQ